MLFLLDIVNENVLTAYNFQKRRILQNQFAQLYTHKRNCRPLVTKIQCKPQNENLVRCRNVLVTWNFGKWWDKSS